MDPSSVKSIPVIILKTTTTKKQCCAELLLHILARILEILNPNPPVQPHPMMKLLTIPKTPVDFHDSICD